RLVGRIKLNAKMSFQGVEIRLALFKFLYLLFTRDDASECTVEQRHTAIGMRERRHTGKSKERAGMGRSKVIPVGDICWNDMSEIKAIEILPLPLQEGLQHNAKRRHLHKTKSLSIVCRRMIEFKRNRGAQAWTTK